MRRHSRPIECASESPAKPLILVTGPTKDGTLVVMRCCQRCGRIPVSINTKRKPNLSTVAVIHECRSSLSVYLHDHLQWPSKNLNEGQPRFPHDVISLIYIALASARTESSHTATTAPHCDTGTGTTPQLLQVTRCHYHILHLYHTHLPHNRAKS